MRHWHSPLPPKSGDPRPRAQPLPPTPIRRSLRPPPAPQLPVPHPQGCTPQAGGLTIRAPPRVGCWSFSSRRGLGSPPRVSGGPCRGSRPPGVPRGWCRGWTPPRISSLRDRRSPPRVRGGGSRGEGGSHGHRGPPGISGRSSSWGREDISKIHEGRLQEARERGVRGPWTERAPRGKRVGKYPGGGGGNPRPRLRNPGYGRKVPRKRRGPRGIER